jgi:hypothetical protein
MGAFAEKGIVDYLFFRLPTKENKRPVFVSVCSKQMEFVVSVFHLKKKKLPFSVSGLSETWRHGKGDTERWRQQTEN